MTKTDSPSGVRLPSHRRQRRGRPVPKGRQVDPAALTEIRALFGGGPLARTHLIDHLHRLQDRYGHLSASHLAALAHELGVPQAVVFEVASFYAHFDAVREGATAPPPVTVRVCDGVACALQGAAPLLAEVQKATGPEVRVVRAPCMGRCAAAPVAVIGRRPVEHADADRIAATIAAGDFAPLLPPVTALQSERHGGYPLLRACHAGARAAEDIVEALDAAGLQGLGGAGFPTARKWRLVRAQEGPRHVVMNADEGEPGTFKDRYFLEHAPHKVLEGLLIAAFVMEASSVHVYLRDEYPAVHEILKREIDAVTRAGLAPVEGIHLCRGAGAYICGEESAMLESLEGRRGLPRHRPPFAAERGLFGRPTLINNVETLYWAREILDRGAHWFAGHGRHGHRGLRAFSVSGRVKRPGVKIVPNGITLRELIDEECGGMAKGHALKAFLPGGASGGILPASFADRPLAFGAFDDVDCFIGSGAVVVLSDHDNVAEVARGLMAFFADESCGQCTPCRLGTDKAARMMAGREWDEAALRDLAAVMREASICGLGQAAPNPLLCTLTYFPEDIGARGGQP